MWMRLVLSFCRVIQCSSYELTVTIFHQITFASKFCAVPNVHVEFVLPMGFKLKNDLICEVTSNSQED